MRAKSCYFADIDRSCVILQDALRPHTLNIWRRHSAAVQASFLRHLRPCWDVHRHRLAPAVAQRLEELQAQGRLHYVAGKVTEAATCEGRVQVSYLPRCVGKEALLEVDRVYNCEGRTGICAGWIRLCCTTCFGSARSDIHGLGVDVDHLGRVPDAEGTVQDQLFAVGPITKGEAWEIIAVPDIRRQSGDWPATLPTNTGSAEKASRKEA